MDFKNYLTELNRGTIIIAVLSQLHQEMYGYDLVVKLNQKGYKIEQTTLYPLLRRLESQGILDSHWNNDDARKKKYYIITKQGVELYSVILQEWKNLNTIIEEMI